LGKLMRRYSNFPKFNLLPALLGTLAMQFPVFIINKLFTKTELGFFDLTQQSILAPFALITVAVSQVLLRQVTDKKNKGEKIYKDIVGLSVILLGIGILSLVIIELFGPSLFSFVFGVKWAMAGICARILIIGYLFFLVVAPMNAVLLGLEEIRLLSIWNLIHFLLMCILLLFDKIGFMLFLKVFAGIEVVSFSVLYVLIMMAVRKYEQSLTGSTNL
jgi:O-antigen/teichoic acid export membrane protein